MNARIPPQPLAAFTLLLTLSTNPLAAEAESGWYLGQHPTSNVDNELNLSLDVIETDLGRGTGVGRGTSGIESIGGTFGYGWQPESLEYLGVRFEGEVAYSRGGLEADKSHALAADQAGVELNQTTVMANLLFDVSVLQSLSAFAGGGIGISQLGSEGFNQPSPGSRAKDDSVMAYQLRLGLGYGFEDRISLFGEYRYSGQGGTLQRNSISTSSLQEEGDEHNFLFGLRYRF